MTKERREALCCALDAGYYAVPRRSTLQELATALDISDTAMSQRLRRGTANVFREVLDE